jgi:hypothetical protein
LHFSFRKNDVGIESKRVRLGVRIRSSARFGEMDSNHSSRVSPAVAANMEAVKALLNLVKPNVPASTRHSAARSIIELGVKLREIADLEQRILALEEQLQRSNSRA